MTGTDVQFAAQALVEALIKEGMKASIDISRASHNAQPDVIHVMVGKKPIQYSVAPTWRAPYMSRPLMACGPEPAIELVAFAP